ncbi:SDR family NAD(P)-dependent oxidoreductase [Pseudonocardia alni]|uniref:SDR family NAD(P)-dependent oxidoreductase n=1 Tax=Pseudonocardia alni TaxID=33907 RepID=UPI00280ABD63|nr:SDR family NAD(P)-dependent oxidoreductase [Pseudonocardia alni]
MALITGGGTGLGAALADRLAARGHDLLLVTRDPERVAPTARELAARYGIRADVLLADLGTRHGLFRLEAFLAGPEAPAVDVLVHDALADAAGAAPDAGRASVDLGMTATMRLTHAALPGMLRRGTGGIVAIGGDERSAAWAVSFVTSLAPTLTGDVHVAAVRGDDRPEWTADAADAVLDDLDAGLVVSAPQSGPARPGPARRAVAAGVRAARRARGAVRRRDLGAHRRCGRRHPGRGDPGRPVRHARGAARRCRAPGAVPAAGPALPPGRGARRRRRRGLRAALGRRSGAHRGAARPRERRGP